MRGNGRGDSGPRRCASAQEAAGQAVALRPRDSPPPQPLMARHHQPVTYFLVNHASMLRAWPGRAAWRAEGVPLKT
jgi:hypothetical protein